MKKWTCIPDGYTPADVPKMETFLDSLPAGYYRSEIIQTMFGPQLLLKPDTVQAQDELIFVKNSPAQDVIDGIKQFIEKRSVFEKNKLTHKRGILLEGPPGSGKTATTFQIADWLIQEQKGMVFFVDPEEFPACQKAMKLIRKLERDRTTMFIMEDIEVIIKMLGNVPEPILAMLDGNQQVGNIIYLATTNYIHKLDDRFTKRPSRFDEIVTIGAPTEEMRYIWLQKQIEKYGNNSGESLGTLVKMTEGMYIAHLRELIVSVFIMGRRVKQTIERLQSMVPPAMPEIKPDNRSVKLTLKQLEALKVGA